MDYHLANPEVEPALPEAATAQQRILASKFDLLISQSSPTPFISIGIAGVLAALLWDVQSHPRLLIWVALVALSGALRLFLFRQYRALRPHADSIPRWKLMYRFTVLLYFSIWGFGGLWIMPADSQLHQLLVMYFLIGLSGGAISVFPADRFSLILAICCLLVPVLLWLVWQGDLLSWGCALAGGLYLASAARSSKVLSSTFTDKLELTERLALARSRAEEASFQMKVALDDAREANEMKSRFFDAANHDLRQPIYAARMMASALDQKKLPGPDSDMLVGISSSLETLSNQLDGFLDLSRLAASVMPVHNSEFSLTGLLQTLQFEFSSLAANKGIEVEFECADDLFVYSDPVLFERVLRNLLNNALAHNTDCTISVSVSAADKGLLLCIADTGRGIPQAQQQLVFEEYFRLEADSKDEHGGLGLGLAIVQRLQSLLGLDMRMESTEGKGTSFYLTVPRAGSR